MKRLLLLLLLPVAALAAPRPNVIFLMADDMGWGQTGYNGHPRLKTPNLDAMAANGLRFERFYAGNPVCSPTRATVLTGRTNDRTGVLSHGYALRRQEKTLAQALQKAGYATGHFGKWHLNGFKGPGAPVLAEDPRSPGAFGFDTWVSATNFIDMNPRLGRQGVPEQFTGDSSEVIVAEALKFIADRHQAGKPFFAVVWFGSPHSPFKAEAGDKAPFEDLDDLSAHHYGELAAMDRSIGTLRARLRELGVADNTLLVFNSDNGGLREIKPSSTGGLRDFKGSVYEGGLRVPGIFEWPAAIRPRVTRHPACTLDLFPTVADVLGLPADVFVQPIDGVSLKPIFAGETGPRARPIPFRYGAKAALIDNHHKILTNDLAKGPFELYDVEADPAEARELSDEQPEVFARLKAALLETHAGIEASFTGRDYPEGRVLPADPVPVFWYEAEAYKPWLNAWKNDWNYASYMNRAAAKDGKAGAKKKKKTDRP
jgi:arylsulfatase A-like enzyme